MAGILSRILDKFRPKQQPLPQTLPGNRGIAAGSIKKPQLDSYAQRVAAGTNTIPVDELEAFLTEGYPLFVHSSNLAMAQFYPEVNKLQVEFKNGSAYMVSPITPDEARSFANSQSKGSWYWSNVRVRGTKTGSKKNVVKIK